MRGAGRRRDFFVVDFSVLISVAFWCSFVSANFLVQSVVLHIDNIQCENNRILTVLEPFDTFLG